MNKANLLICLTLMLFSALSIEAKSLIPENGVKNEIFENNGKFGLRNKATGKITLPAVYDSIQESFMFSGVLSDRGLTSENIFTFHKDGKSGIFNDPLSKIILQPGAYTKFEQSFGWAHPCNAIPCIKVVPATGEEWYLTDCGVKFNKGDIHTTLLEDVSYTFEPNGACFSPKLYKGFIIEKNDKLGYMNKYGKTLILPKFDEWIMKKSEYGIVPIYQRLLFRNFNKSGTGFTVYAYSLDGTLLASKFFYKDQEKAYYQFLRRYL